MSFLFELDPRQEAAADLIADIGRQLQTLHEDRQATGKLTQQDIATRLGVDRARVNKCLSGYNNLTLRTLAELVWAMDGEIEVTIRLPQAAGGTSGGDSHVPASAQQAAE
jgi:predicted XRE-type DNA-binding protein